MIKLNADGYSKCLMWLGFYEGLLHTFEVTLTQSNLDFIAKSCQQLADAFEGDLPASTGAARTIVREMAATVTYVRLRVLLDQFKATLTSEMKDRRMIVLPRGEEQSRPNALTPPTPISRRAGGRPAKAWWDDLWAEIAKQLYDGDLKPDRQVDIESAMHDWIAKTGHSAGETQVRERARKLFILMNK
jgi:hypothetical protein